MRSARLRKQHAGDEQVAVLDVNCSSSRHTADRAHKSFAVRYRTHRENILMEDLYTSGQYLATTQTWHSEDSPWKAEQVAKIIRTNRIQPGSIAEIGCGAGVILSELLKSRDFVDVRFRGYDISPQAIELSKGIDNDRLEFVCEDLLSEQNRDYFDLLLIVDVFEHIPDYTGFVDRCGKKAAYKIYHIPLDIHVSSVLRNAFIRQRYNLGHLHYFTAESAIATLRDAGQEILDVVYTNAAFGLFKQHPSFKRGLANIPRWLFSKFSVPFTARVFGGYSLLVLTK